MYGLFPLTLASIYDRVALGFVQGWKVVNGGRRRRSERGMDEWRERREDVGGDTKRGDKRGAETQVC
jgi:hypothetical protein